MTRTLDGLTIGEAAKAAGVTRKAVRVYERRGLLPAAPRTAAGYRLYDHTHVELLRFIRRARLLGLRLDDVGEVLAIHAGGEPPCVAVRGMLDARIAEIDAALAELRALRSTLTEAVKHADHDLGAAVVCGIIEDSPVRSPSS
jgi:DNA-binding transcriptional MerR regulator